VSTPEEQPELFGREAEEERIRRLVADARKGRSGVLVIRGEAGAGKTALLDRATEYEPTLRVLRTRCVQSEATFAFGALTDILRPVVALADQLPAGQRNALRVSLAVDEAVRPPGGVAVGLGTLGVLAEAAPALVVVDDLQWMDAGSRSALLFAARRLVGEGVAVLVAVRHGDQGGDLADLPTLELGGLPAEAARALVARVRGEPPDDDEFALLLRYSAGHPLALVELSRRPAGVPHGHDRPPPPPDTVADAYRQRLAPLDPAVRRALLLCAASFTGELAELAEVLGPAGLDALSTAEAAGLVTTADGIEFAHPLIRSTVYHAATPRERRAAHAAIARALRSARGRLWDRHVWHLAAAAFGPDDDVADALADLAARSLARGAMREAYAVYLRAAQLTSAPREREQRRYRAAEAAHLAGDTDAATAAIDRIDTDAAGVELRAAVAQLNTQIQFTRAKPADIFTTVSGAAAAAPEQAATPLWVTAAGVGAVAGLVPEALAAAERALAAQPAQSHDIGPAVLYAHTSLLTGHHERARDVVSGYLATLTETDPLQHGIEVFGFATMDLMWLGEYGSARDVLRTTLTRLRRADAMERLPSLLSVLADLEARCGAWNAAYGTGAECRSLADAVGQPLLAGYAASTMALVDAAQGDESRCAQNVRDALDLLEPLGAELVIPYAHLALGRIELAAGRPERAVDRLTNLANRLDRLGVRDPVVFPYHADLVESLFRTGNVDRAGKCLDDLVRRSGHEPVPAARVAIARCRGLLADDEAEAERHFVVAMEEELATGDEYAAARTRLLFGERLRRARRRGRAQEQLAAARLVFERLGAHPWERRAAGELRVGGTTPGSAGTPLTNQEVRVARRAAEGLSNREIAATLFLSVKTVEYHLSNCYHKLGVRSRVELVRAFSTAVEHR